MMCSIPSRHKDGRLGVSPAAMKVIAKALATEDPLSAVLAGLRHGKADLPFEFLGKRGRELTVVGCPGSGFREVAHGHLYEASRAGFRVLIFSSDPAVPWRGVKGDELSRQFWTPMREGRNDVLVRKETRSQARLLDLLSLGDSPHGSKAGLWAFLGTSLADPAVRQIIVRLPWREKGPHAAYDAVMTRALEALGELRSALTDTVVALDECWVPDHQTAFLRRSAGGLLNVHTPEAARTHTRPGAPCFFAKGADPATERLEVGEGRIGSWGDPVGEMASSEPMYRPFPIPVLDPPVLRALDRIAAQPGVADLSHTARLDLVARAAGYENWEKAQGRRRGPNRS